MAEIINLRRARKSKARAAAEADAGAKRIAFGRRKDEEQLTKTLNDAAERRLDGHKRDDDNAS
jgi:hypothetical protein